ncbi:MAG: hypothetical protein LC808_15470 [Actinobacteria bacterium]|nr:hypothetical protein [Actinomycetota bacterium]
MPVDLADQRDDQAGPAASPQGTVAELHTSTPRPSHLAKPGVVHRDCGD